jgi:hypothetical protein
MGRKSGPEDRSYLFSFARPIEDDSQKPEWVSLFMFHPREKRFELVVGEDTIDIRKGTPEYKKFEGYLKLVAKALAKRQTVPPVPDVIMKKVARPLVVSPVPEASNDPDPDYDFALPSDLKPLPNSAGPRPTINAAEPDGVEEESGPLGDGIDDWDSARLEAFLKNAVRAQQVKDGQGTRP